MPRPPEIVRYSPYMLQLERKLKTTPTENKKTNRSDETINNIMRTLRVVCGEKFQNLNALKDIKAVEKSLEKYAPSTRTTMLKHMYVALWVDGQKDLYEKYYALWKVGQAAINKQEDSHEATDQQEKRMLPTSDLRDILTKNRAEVAKLPTDPTPKEFAFCLGTALLALYTLIPPRRNMDYEHLYVVPKLPTPLEPGKNYLALKEKKLVFQTYKTAATYGTQEHPVPKELFEILEEVISRHPNKDAKEYLMFVNQSGRPVSRFGGIQNLLKAAGADTTSTAIRHSFLSEKYEALPDAEKERDDTATAMAHSKGTQLKYVRKRKTLEKKSD